MKLVHLRIAQGILLQGLVALPNLTQQASFQKFSEQNYTQYQQAIQQGRASDIVQTLSNQVVQHPSDLRLRNLLGLARTSMKDLQAADLEFAEVLRQSPHFTPALRNLAINEAALGEVKESDMHFRQVLTLLPGDPVANAYLGSAAFLAADLPEASRLLAAAGFLASDPTIAFEQKAAGYLSRPAEAASVQSFSFQGIDLSKVSQAARLAAAAQLARRGEYSHAVDLYRSFPDGLLHSNSNTFNYASCLLALKRPLEAQSLLQRFFQKHAPTSELLQLSAEALEATQQQQMAIDALRQSIALSPENDDPYVALAELCSRYDAFDVGIEVLNVGLGLRPNADRLLFERGVLEGMKNDYTAAERDLKRAGDLAPQKSAAAIAFGVNLMQTGRSAEAIRELRDKVKVNPSNAMLQYLLAEALLRNGAVQGSPEYAEAEGALSTAVASDRNFVPAMVSMARLLIREQKLDSAYDLLSRAVQLDPSDRTAYSQLAIVDRKLGKKVEADAAITALNAINEKQRIEDKRLRISTGTSQ